jgi:regulatory protein
MSEEQRFLASCREEQGSVWLTLDSGEVFELAPGSVPANLPQVGESLSSPLLAEIKLAAERKQVARRLFAMLDRRLSPVSRLRQKLTDRGFSGRSVDQVLQQMAESDLYSDRHYAEAYCRDCLRTRTVGRRYLEKKLRDKGVDAALAAAVPAEILDAATEQELALAAAQARWRRQGTVPAGDQRRRAEARVIRYLVGRGFSPTTAIDACKQAARELEEEA